MNVIGTPYVLLHKCTHSSMTYSEVLNHSSRRFLGVYDTTCLFESDIESELPSSWQDMLDASRHPHPNRVIRQTDRVR